MSISTEETEEKPKPKPKAPRKRKAKKVDARPLTSILTTAHVADDSARSTLSAQQARFYDDLQWRKEEGASGTIDRLMGRRKK